MNACEAVRELLTASALKALDEGQAVLVKDHLGGCGECRAVEATTLAAVACIAAPPVEPPAELWDKLRGKLARERGGDEPVRDLDPSAVIAISCSFCRGGLVRNDTVYCASCLAPHHQDCFAEHGRCSVMGCGETRVVRPEGLAPPKRVAEPAPRHRWRWIAGGLIGVATGGAVAALSLRDVPEPPKVAQVAPLPAQVAQVAPEVPRALTPTFVPPRLDVEVREATVGELTKQIEGAIPIKLHLAPEAAGRALPDRDWWNASWDEVLTDVAAATGLELAKGGEGGPAPWAMLLAPEGESKGVVPPERTWLTGVDVLAADQGEWKLTRLAELPGARALPSPAQSGVILAIVGDRRVRLSRGGIPLGGLRLAVPVRRATWSPEGDELYLLCGEPGGEATLMRITVQGGHPSVGVVHQLGQSEASNLVALHDGWVLVGRGGRLPAQMIGRGGIHVDLHVGPGPLVGALARVNRHAFAATQAELWRCAPGSTSWSVDQQLELLAGNKDGAVALLPAPASKLERMLVVEPGRARVSELKEGTRRWIDTITPGRWPSAIAISPDGERVAWCDQDALFVRPVAPGEGVPAKELHLSDGRVGEPQGLAWDEAGNRLAVWTDKALWLPEGPGNFRLVHELPAGPGVIEEVHWLRDGRLAVAATLGRPRQPEVRVFPAREGGDPWARPERVRFQDEPVSVKPQEPQQKPQEQEQAPPPAPPEPPPPVAVPAPTEPPAPPPEPAVRLSHVRPGQRWVFKVGTRVTEEWTITAVDGDRVGYERRIYLGEQLIDQAAKETWTPDQLITGEVHASRGPEPDREVGTLTLGEVTLGVAIDDQAGVELWRAVDETGRYTFPGVLKETRGGKVHRELLRVGRVGQ